jgi:thiosulfate/3-mercaptopyruvate sulfurtransferase
MSLPLVALVFMLSNAEQAKSYPRPELLIEPTDLAKEAAKGMRILDARGKGKYLDGHVPGGVWIDATTWARTFGDGADKAAWEARIGALGITPSTAVAIYDDNSSKDASRMWWILRYWGIRDVRLVNGGWRGYLQTGGPVDKSEVKPVATAPKLSPQRERLATKSRLMDLVNGGPGETQIVDTRSMGEFCGTEEHAKRNGAIPAAVHLEWSDTLDGKTGRFKSAEELGKILRAAGIDANKPAITYCQSGGRASVMAFALELMGTKDVSNYYKSWTEWGNDPQTPVIKPNEKK